MRWIKSRDVVGRWPGDGRAMVGRWSGGRRELIERTHRRLVGAPSRPRRFGLVGLPSRRLGLTDLQRGSEDEQANIAEPFERGGELLAVAARTCSGSAPPAHAAVVRFAAGGLRPRGASRPRRSLLPRPALMGVRAPQV